MSAPRAGLLFDAMHPCWIHFPNTSYFPAKFVKKKSKAKRHTVVAETNVSTTNSEENAVPQQTTSTAPPPPQKVPPGAVAVAGPNASDYDSDELFSVTAPAPPPPPQDETPLTARLVHGSEHDIETLQEQLQKQNEQLRQQDEKLQNVILGMENAAIAQVISQGDGYEVRAGNEAVSTGSAGHNSDQMASNKHRCGTQVKWATVVAIVLVIVGIVLGVILPSKSSTTSAPATASQDLIDMLSTISLDGGSALQTPSTPQNKALNWLAGNANLDEYTEERKIQRYVLATLYYSTNGDDWYNNDGWLTDSDECEWYNGANTWSFCVSGLVSELDLYDSSIGGNNLVGTIPDEIALLSNSIGECLVHC